MLIKQPCFFCHYFIWHILWIALHDSFLKWHYLSKIRCKVTQYFSHLKILFFAYYAHLANKKIKNAICELRNSEKCLILENSLQETLFHIFILSNALLPGIFWANKLVNSTSTSMLFWLYLYNLEAIIKVIIILFLRRS